MSHKPPMNLKALLALQQINTEYFNLCKSRYNFLSIIHAFDAFYAISLVEILGCRYACL